MPQPDHPILTANVMAGLNVKIYQSKSYPGRPGRWHAHIVPMTPSKEGRVWYALDLWESAELQPTIDQINRPWTSCSASDRDELNVKLATILGKLYAARMLQLLQPYVPPTPKTIYPPREFPL